MAHLFQNPILTQSPKTTATTMRIFADQQRVIGNRIADYMDSGSWSMGDDEWNGLGNSYMTMIRQYDVRVGRWMSIDPALNELPWKSSFISMDNNPILYNDPMGDKVYCEDDETKKAVKEEKKESKEFRKRFRMLLRSKETNVFNGTRTDDKLNLDNDQNSTKVQGLFTTDGENLLINFEYGDEPVLKEEKLPTVHYYYSIAKGRNGKLNWLTFQGAYFDLNSRPNQTLNIGSGRVKNNDFYYRPFNSKLNNKRQYKDFQARITKAKELFPISNMIL